MQSNFRIVKDHVIDNPFAYSVAALIIVWAAFWPLLFSSIFAQIAVSGLTVAIAFLLGVFIGGAPTREY